MKRLLLGVTLLLIAVGAAAAFYWHYHQERSALELAGVVESQEVRLGSKLGGRVESVEVIEGATVQTDQILVRLAKPELDAQREQAKARVAAAKAAHDKAETGPQPEEKDAAAAAMEAARAKWERMEYGWREEEKAQAQFELDSAKADLDWAENVLRRDERLHEQSRTALSQIDLDTSRANRDRAKGRFEAARAKAQMLRTGNRPEDKAEAKAEFARAKANYELLRKGTREEDKAAAKAQWEEAKAKLTEIESQCAEANVRAPGPAFVEVVSVRRGDLVQPNQPIIRILKIDDIWVKVYVPETELGKVRKNQQVEVTIDSHPGRRFPGRISHIDAISEFLPRNVQSLEERRNQVFGVKVVITEAGAEEIFKPGMQALVHLPLRP